jgi:hypothetical protein
VIVATPLADVFTEIPTPGLILRIPVFCNVTAPFDVVAVIPGVPDAAATLRTPVF